jgi:hypothetical protein
MFKRHCITGLGAFLAICPVQAKDTLGVFGDWGAFKDRRVCYAVSSPTGSSGKGRAAPQLVVSKWPGQNVPMQVMVGGGTALQSATLRAGSQSFKLAVRGDSGWLADSGSDAQALAALAASGAASVTGRSARGSKFTDSYSLTGFSEAWATAQKACR